MSINSINADLSDWLILYTLTALSPSHHSLSLPLHLLYVSSSSKMVRLFQRSPRGKLWTDIYFSLALWQDSRMFNSLTFLFCFRDVWLISLTNKIIWLLPRCSSPQLHFLFLLLLSLGLCGMSNLWHHMWFHSNKLTEYMTIKNSKIARSYLSISTHNHCPGL